MNVRAKFMCYSVRKTYTTKWVEGKATLGYLYDYEFHVVHGDTEENKKFFASTPSGTVNLMSIRDDLFDPGKEYYLDFSPAAEPID